MPEIFKLIPPVWLGCTALIATLFAAFAFAGGTVFGFVSFNYAARIEIRKRIEQGYAARTMTWLAECRAEERKQPTDQVLVSVRAPILDSAGVPTESEENIFTAVLLDLSRKGAGLFSQHFLPAGLNIQIACNSKHVSFPYRLCKVRDIVLTPKGLRIGVEFFKIHASTEAFGGDTLGR